MATSSVRHSLSWVRNLWRMLALLVLLCLIWMLCASPARGQPIDIINFDPNNPPTLGQFTTNPNAFAIVADKRFDNFSFTGTNTDGQPLNPFDIQVTGLVPPVPFPDPGLFFSKTQGAPSNFILDPTPGMGTFTLEYDVTVTDAKKLIKDNLVEIGAPAPPLGSRPGPGNSAEILEDVFDPLDLNNPIASKRAFSDSMADQIIDTADFTPLPQVHVQTVGNVTNSSQEPFAFIQTFSQTFSQTTVPEPSAAAAWIVAGLALLLALPMLRLRGNGKSR